MTLADGLVLAVHLIGASIWVGGSISLGVVSGALRAWGRDRHEGAAAQVAVIGRRLAVVMWPALAVTILTGLYNLTWFLPPGATIEGDPVLLAKVVTVAVVVVTSGLHTFVLGPRLRRRREAGVAESELSALRRSSVALAMLSTVSSVLVLVFASLLGGP